MADAVLKGLPNATALSEIICECVKNAERGKRADSYLGEIAKELLRYGTLERILPNKGKRAALQNIYEDLKNIPSIRDNPQFWLQYAMSRLALGELDVARRYFETSYALAKKASGYDTFQIDNHYCRLLLLEAEQFTDKDEAFKAVNEAMGILKRQVLRENRHYPFRSVQNIEGVTKRHGSTWTKEQKKTLVGAALYLVDAARRLDSKVAGSTVVVGGLQRLNRVIEELS
jgi:tetratricopeptide (TPR) repeat protein